MLRKLEAMCNVWFSIMIAKGELRDSFNYIYRSLKLNRMILTQLKV